MPGSAALVVTIVKRHLKYALELLFVPIAAAIVFIEETLLHYLGLAMAAIAKWPPVARLEAWLRGLPPWGALLAFVAPSLLVIPIKLSAVWFAFHHRYGLSLASVVVGKMLATALVARLYQVLRPTPGEDAVVPPRRDLAVRLARPALRLRARPAGLAAGQGDDPARAALDARNGLWRLVTLGFAACLKSFPARGRSVHASKASTAAAPTSPTTAALLNRALAEHLLVVVPGERMAPGETLAFARAFGKPRTQLLRYKRSGDVPEVSVMVSTLMADGTTDKTAIRAEDWHTDDSYFAVPAKATLLHGIEIPSRGGATWFCNMHSVYEALPAKLQAAHRRHARHPWLRHAARPQPAVGAHAAGDRRDARRRASPGAHPSRDGPQGALSQSQPARPHRRTGARRERCAAR